MKCTTFETVLSDPHKITRTILRKTVKVILKKSYRDYSRFGQRKSQTKLNS